MNLRIITYNIHKGFSLSNLAYTLDLIKAGLQKTGADIVCLQEVCGRQSHFSNSRLSNLEKQFEYLADGHWKEHSYGKNAAYSTGDHGNAILSQFPIESFDNSDLSLHRYEQRGLLHCKLKISQSQTLHVFTTHLNLLARDRKIQTEKVIDQIHSKVPESEPVIFCGDFNDWTQELSAPLIKRLHFSEAFQITQGKLAESFPSYFPILPLDRVYFRGLRAIKTETLRDRSWSKLSDHLPLLVDFEL